MKHEKVIRFTVFCFIKLNQHLAITFEHNISLYDVWRLSAIMFLTCCLPGNLINFNRNWYHDWSSVSFSYPSKPADPASYFHHAIWTCILLILYFSINLDSRFCYFLVCRLLWQRQGLNRLHLWQSFIGLVTDFQFLMQKLGFPFWKVSDKIFYRRTNRSDMHLKSICF